MSASEIDVASEPFGIEPADCAAESVTDSAADSATHSAADSATGVPLLDVRRAATYAQAASRIAGAAWRDPAAPASWAGEFAPGSRVVVYCVHGHEVSRSTALQLRAAGLDARFLRGGIEAWQAAGLPLERKPGVG